MLKIIICSICKKEKESYRSEICNICYMKKYYLENKEKHLINMKKWRLKNKEKIKPYMRNYYLSNKEKWIESNRNRNQKEEVKKYKKEWRRKFRQTIKGKIYDMKDHVLRRTGNAGTFIEIVIKDNLSNFGIFTCENCRKQMLLGFDIDHIKAVSKGGTNKPENLQLLCKKCNKEKFTKTIDYRVKAYLEAH